MNEQPDIVTTLRRESFYCPTSRINSYGKAQFGFELMSINLQAADEIERLRAERDEARRDWCRLWAAGGPRRQLSSTQAARLRQWDCFKGETP